MTANYSKKPSDEQTMAAPAVALDHFLDNKGKVIKTLMDLNPVPITINRIEDGCFVQVNRSWCELTG